MKKSKKIISFIFLIVIFILSINSIGIGDTGIDSDGETVGYFPVFDSPLNNLTPNFQIISIVDKKVINIGDEFSISFQISGNGRVVANKLVIYFPDSLLKDNPKFYVYIQEAKDNDTGKVVGAKWLDKEPVIVETDKKGVIINVINVTFMQIDPYSVFGEKAIYEHRPINIKAIASDSASSGDNIIRVVLFYSDGVNWYSSQDSVVIYIQEWYETWWGNIVIGLIIGSLLIIGAFAYRKLTKKKDRFECPINQQTTEHDTNNGKGKKT